MWLDSKHKHVSLTGDLSYARRNERPANASGELPEPSLGDVERSDACHRTCLEGTLGQRAAQISNADNAQRYATAHDLKCTTQGASSI